MPIFIAIVVDTRASTIDKCAHDDTYYCIDCIVASSAPSGPPIILDGCSFTGNKLTTDGGSGAGLSTQSLKRYFEHSDADLVSQFV